jgi:hypothetical protein
MQDEEQRLGAKEVVSTVSSLSLISMKVLWKVLDIRALYRTATKKCVDA